MDATTSKAVAMLRILYGASAAALDAFRATDSRVDDQLLIDLEAMVKRTKGEIARLGAGLGQPS